MSNNPKKVFISSREIRTIWDRAYTEMRDLDVEIMRELGDGRSYQSLCFVRAVTSELRKMGLIDFIADYEKERGDK